MGDIIDINYNNEIQSVDEENGLIQLTDALLEDARTGIQNRKTMSVPIAKLSVLGESMSSLIPAFNTVTQTTTIATDGLFRVANAAAGDTLKIAKNGNAWGAMKTAAGKSKMAQFAEVGPLSATTQTVAAFNPATMMMAAALYSIEKELDGIAETQKKILSFLEVENESQIEADVEQLTGIVKNYKYNWDNERSVTSNHKLVIDIQNRARKNMIAYQKKVAEATSGKQLVVAQTKVQATLSDLEKKFKYYRLSLYTYSLAAFMEIMLSGNFKEEYIASVKDEIKMMSSTYRHQFENCSRYLEKLGKAGVEANLLKGIGTAGKAMGKFIGSIPIVEKGPVDEFLQDSGSHLKKNARNMVKKAVRQFAPLSSPGTRVFIEQMEEMIQIYNHTEQICFDDKKIYLIASESV